MGFALVRRFAIGAALIAAGLLNACGGGGGGGDDGTDPPPPVGGDLEGRLWHTNYALDFLDGTQIASAEGGMPATVTDDLPAWPWPDGTQYVVADAESGYTDVTTHATGTGAVVNDVRFEGYLRSVKPSPVSKQVILATWGIDSVSPADYLIYNLATRTILDRFATNGAVVSWLPDGRYLRVSASGAITTAQPGGTPSAAGSVAIPAGREIRGVWVNPQGTQMAMQFIVPGSSDRGIEESDLWVASADGSNLGQLTDTGITSYGKWSPDGTQVAFDTDTGLVCNGGGCTGQCALWFAPATSRNVKALESSNDAEHFRVKNTRGEERSLGCELLSWTE
jgi:hypothetical protein